MNIEDMHCLIGPFCSDFVTLVKSCKEPCQAKNVFVFWAMIFIWKKEALEQDIYLYNGIQVQYQMGYCNDLVETEIKHLIIAIRFLTAIYF